MSDHYGCRVVLPLDTPLLLFLLGYHTGAHPPGGGDMDEYSDVGCQQDMIYLLCRASRHPYIRSWGDTG
eukprot:CAMPEP_0171043254 /NCGR_PEP_ID=MMETSP0736-20130129/46891_1 /TAXON_ID=186038 /ORGANISM="Fragilariopsis kerguelensis, Strain L26-C5" /LENGTH=68 /DNA_ID=CAMNT_0011492191 /DNA_START=1 /DNA_END=203 /DNA_ORIENTATION=+